MQGDRQMVQDEPGMKEEVRAKLSTLAADLKRISDRLMELSGQAEAAADEHHNACECAEGEADHADFLVPDFAGQASATSGPQQQGDAESAALSEGESPAILPQVLDELRRHLGRMDRSMTDAVAAGREVGELGCELLRCERDVQALLDRCTSEIAPDDGSVPS